MGGGEDFGSYTCDFADRAKRLLRVTSVFAAVSMAGISSGCGSDIRMSGICLDQSGPRALAESYQKAAARRDFDGMVACVAPGDRDGIVALTDASKAFYKTLPKLLFAIRQRFGPELARQVRVRTDVGLPMPFLEGGPGPASGPVEVTIGDHGDVALYSVSGYAAAKARLLGTKWYFVAENDEYGRGFLPSPIAVGIWRGALQEMNSMISGIQQGLLTEEDVRKKILE